jgi:hypothetical protein
MTMGLESTEAASPRVPRYRLFARGRRLKVVREGWCWPGFLLPWAWPLLGRLWGFGGAITVCFGSAYALYLLDGGSVALGGVAAVEAGGRMAAGLWTHALYRRRLSRAGWAELEIVQAISAEDARVTERLRHPELD